MKKKATEKKKLQVRRNRISPKNAGFYCNARRRGRNEYCKQRAGFGTPHVGQGRCKFHGGLTPTKHGVYSKILPIKFHELLEEIKPKEITDLTCEIIKLKTLLMQMSEIDNASMEVELDLDDNGDPIIKKLGDLTIQEELDYVIKIITAITKTASTIEANRERAAKRQDHRQELLKFITPLVSVFYKELEFVIRDKRISREDIARSHRDRLGQRTVWD